MNYQIQMAVCLHGVILDTHDDISPVSSSYGISLLTVLFVYHSGAIGTAFD